MFGASMLLIWSTFFIFPQIYALPTISVTGAKFFTSDGDQWFIKGIAYQRSPDDPLLDANQCTADANLMATLGTNSIRVYHVNPNGNHDACMKAFSDNGIYVFIDLDTFDTTLLSTDPGSQPSWNSYQFTRYSEVMDAFAGYDNTGGFFIGNEVIFTNTESPAAPYIKAAARDMKAYRDSKGYRPIPVGYAAADIAELRPQLQNYLVCGGDRSATVDFFGLNSYEWCGPANYQSSGYSNLQAMADGYPAPIFFSETGCNVAPPRTFADQAAIFGPDMVNTWSGAMIYEWMQEQNDYGLISYGGTVGDPARAGTPTPIVPDFNNLKSAWKVSPSGVKLSDYQKTASALSTPACPAATPGGWAVNGNIGLPAAQNQIIQLSSSATPSAVTTQSQSQSTAISGVATGSSTGSATGSATVTGAGSSGATGASGADTGSNTSSQASSGVTGSATSSATSLASPTKSSLGSRSVMDALVILGAIMILFI